MGNENAKIIRVPGLIQVQGCTYNAIATILDRIKKDLNLAGGLYFAQSQPYHTATEVHMDNKGQRIVVSVSEGDTFSIIGLPESYNPKSLEDLARAPQP